METIKLSQKAISKIEKVLSSGLAAEYRETLLDAYERMNLVDESEADLSPVKQALYEYRLLMEACLNSN